MADIKKIRNFSIVAHINHGKSTLADRFLELTNTVSKEKMRPQFLDQMGLEQERGITIKMQPVRMEWKGYILNLIDTPGHVDFSYEVSRALAAVEGAILLVDAQKGVQAQTLSHLRVAQKLGIKIIPVVNKIDLPQARTEEVKKEVASLLDVSPDVVEAISAKTNEGVLKLLEILIEKIPSPSEQMGAGARALVFDSSYDPFKGVIAYVRMFGGTIRAANKIFFKKSGFQADVLETGIFRPQREITPMLQEGEIGYIATGLKEVGTVKVGDTIVLNDEKDSQAALSGYEEPQPVVFASFYPIQADEWDMLRIGLGKLKLNDAALQFEPESSSVLGRGFKLGFLGLLHLEIVAERLKREFGLQFTVSTPSVSYELITKNKKNLNIHNAALLPADYEKIKEPWVALEIVTPLQYLGTITQLVHKRRGIVGETKSLGPQYLLINAEAPLQEIIVGFYDQLKSSTAGFASLVWKMAGFRESDLVKLEILVAGEKVEGLTRLVHRSVAYGEGRSVVEKLKNLLPSEQFVVTLQAVADGRIIARETIKAMRKDVTGYLYGGDRSRKDKLLKKQKEGKKKMQATGKVRIPARVFLELSK